MAVSNGPRKRFACFAMVAMLLAAAAPKIAAAQINPSKPAGAQQSGPASVSASVRIHVSTNGAPVSGVQLAISGKAAKHGVTNASGIFTAVLPPGSYTIKASKGSASTKLSYTVTSSTQDITVNLP